MIVTEVMIIAGDIVVINVYCLHCRHRCHFITIINFQDEVINIPNLIIGNLSMDDMPNILFTSVISVSVMGELAVQRNV